MFDASASPSAAIRRRVAANAWVERMTARVRCVAERDEAYGRALCRRFVTAALMPIRCLRQRCSAARHRDRPGGHAVAALSAVNAAAAVPGHRRRNASPAVVDVGVGEGAVEAERRGRAVRQIGASACAGARAVGILVEHIVAADGHAPAAQRVRGRQVQGPFGRIGLVGGGGGAEVGEFAPARGRGGEGPGAGRPYAAQEELVARRTAGDAADLGTADAYRGRVDRFQDRRVAGDLLDVGLVVV